MSSAPRLLPGPLTPYDAPSRMPGHVLLVDDEERIRTSMTRLLTRAGFEVRTAASVQEGLDVLRTDRRVRVILLDMMMPEQDGWTFRRIQLASPLLSEIPAVVLTGAPLPSLSHAQLRAADYLLKPVGGEHLISVVTNYCEPGPAR